jgi:hypothetical protein
MIFLERTMKMITTRQAINTLHRIYNEIYSEIIGETYQKRYRSEYLLEEEPFLEDYEELLQIARLGDIKEEDRPAYNLSLLRLHTLLGNYSAMFKNRWIDYDLKTMEKIQKIMHEIMRKQYEENT